MTAPLHIVWFKRDLRIEDHRPLWDAARCGPKTEEDRIFGLRGSRSFRSAFDVIQDKHGSRKSGFPMTGQKRATKKKASGQQMEFDV